MIGWSSNIFIILCQVIFPSCALGETDHWLSVEHETMYILKLKYNNASIVFIVVAYWHELLFNSLVDAISVIFKCITKIVADWKVNILTKNTFGSKWPFPACLSVRSHKQIHTILQTGSQTLIIGS